MQIYKLPCGCAVDRKTEHLVEMCPPCKEAHDERRERAALDRLRLVADAVARNAYLIQLSADRSE